MMPSFNVLLLLLLFVASHVADAQQFGFVGCQIVPGDYNGDGKADMAVFYQTTGRWYIMGYDGAVIKWGYQWGYDKCVAVPGDYNNDGIDDLTLYDTNSLVWYSVAMPSNSVIIWNRYHGTANAIPVPGDYNGDGSYDLCTYDKVTYKWNIINKNGTGILSNYGWGYSGVLPSSGDYDGDGIHDLAVYDPNQIQYKWYVASVTNSVVAYNKTWGYPGCRVVSGKYDSNNSDDYVVYDYTNKIWHIATDKATNVIAWFHLWGLDKSIGQQLADFDGDGKSDYAVVSPDYIWQIFSTAKTTNQPVVMTFNLGVTRPDKNPDYAKYIEDFAEYVTNNFIDIIALQEVPSNRNGNVNFAELLVQNLNSKGYGCTAKFESRNRNDIFGIYNGMAIISRTPMLRYYAYKFDAEWTNYGHHNFHAKDHIFQKAEFALGNGSDLVVFNIHPNNGSSVTTNSTFPQDFESVVVPFADRNVIVIGDYNVDTPSFWAYATNLYLYTNFLYWYTDDYDLTNDATLLVTSDPTIQTNLTYTVGVDHIFCSETVNLLDAYSDHSVTNSDHYPVIGVINVP